MTRVYRSDVRAHKLHETRLRVLRAAVTLFSTQGFVGTSVGQIAALAEASLDTVYRVGDKSAVFLQALEFVLTDMPDATPLFDAPSVARTLQTGTLDQVLEMVADTLLDSNRRSAAMWAAFVEGSRSEASIGEAFIARNARMRAEGHQLLELIVGRGLIAPPDDPDVFVDRLWAEAHPHRYALLTGLAGWSETMFRDELLDTLRRVHGLPRG